MCVCMCVYQIGMGRDAKGVVVLHARQMSPLSGCSLGFSYFALCSCVVVVRLFSSFYFSVLFRLWLLFNMFDDDDVSSAIPLSWNGRNALKHFCCAYRCNPWQRCRIDPFYFLLIPHLSLLRTLSGSSASRSASGFEEYKIVYLVVAVVHTQLHWNTSTNECRQ